MKIKISFFGVLMIATIAFTRSYISLAALLSAFLHELGHIFAARICGVPIKELRLDIFGASLVIQKAICSYGREIFVAASGPTVNILMCIGLLGIYRTNAFFSLLFAASLFLAVLNLLPIQDFDGGRILYCSVAILASERTAAHVCPVLSFMILLFLWMLSVYFLLVSGATLSLFVFSFALLCKILVSSASRGED